MADHSQLALAFPVRDEFTFSRFQTEDDNQHLVSYLSTFSEQQDKGAFLWGCAASGKTHLLQALCHQEDSSVYIPLKTFLSQPPGELLQGLEQLSVICIDDVQVVAGQREWEESLFQLYNAVRELNHTLWVSADKPLASLSFTLADLHSRLSWGMNFQVHELCDEGKGKVLKNRASERGISLSDELLQYILLRSERNMHSLCSLLDRLDTLSLIEKRKVTIPYIKKIMQW